MKLNLRIALDCCCVFSTHVASSRPNRVSQNGRAQKGSLSLYSWFGAVTTAIGNGAVIIAILVVWSGHNRYRQWSGHYRYTRGLERSQPLYRSTGTGVVRKAVFFLCMLLGSTERLQPLQKNKGPLRTFQFS